MLNWNQKSHRNQKVRALDAYNKTSFFPSSYCNAILHLSKSDLYRHNLFVHYMTFIKKCISMNKIDQQNSDNQTYKTM